ncbi:ATP phosphoribosyltransferase regulatory subunit [Oceanobacillus sp. CAU 1775]
MKNETEGNLNRAVLDFYYRDQLVSIIKKRFSTYSYQQVHTSTFEDYDMYASIRNTVNKDEMIKVIDQTGKVLVLRPDGTIPITRMTAQNTDINTSEQRLFYVLDVFRQTEENSTDKESTQAGVELIGNKTPESDAEVIALAIHSLKDIGFKNFKIEIGHAGFVKELIKEAALSADELQQLQAYIQSKNIVEMQPYLQTLKISRELQNALYAIPLLYGEPENVLKKTKEIIRNKNMQTILDNLQDVIEVLKDYEVMNHITLNLGLINNMDYYTDIIFQGFVDEIGKPVLMGGRYDNLGAVLGKDLAAIGFAFEVDILLQAMKQAQLTANSKLPNALSLQYEQATRKEALKLASELRDAGFNIRTVDTLIDANLVNIQVKKDNHLLRINGNLQPFHSFEELVEMLKVQKEDN